MEAKMRRSPAVPLRRPTPSAVCELRREAARVEAMVALILALSIVALIYVISHDTAAAARAAAGLV